MEKEKNILQSKYTINQNKKQFVLSRNKGEFTISHVFPKKDDKRNIEDLHKFKKQIAFLIYNKVSH